MNMAKKGIVTGLVLIALGMIGYFVGGRVSVTALIPAFVGLPILLSSLLARSPEKRKLGMHLAVFFWAAGISGVLGETRFEGDQRGVRTWPLNRFHDGDVSRLSDLRDSVREVI